VGKRPPISRIEEIAREHGVEALVVGLPLELSGSESEWSTEVRSVAERLANRLDLPVHLVDERMSSVRAERAVRSSGRSRSQREDKDRVDAAAAAILLQDWLDRRKGAIEQPEEAER
jgi:putative Holliday junction resolvase